MTWQARSLMDVKREFVELALQQGANRRELCRRFGISPKTGYALLKRHASEGTACLVARYSRPRNSPTRTAAPLEQAAVALRRQHPSGLISAQASEAAAPRQRVEHEQPHALWQIDFKGRFETQAGRCHPLTLLDDHPRCNLSLHACARADTPSVKAQLQDVFTRYGLPVRINADNGSPWGRARLLEHGITELTVWLIRLGIRVSRSAPYHPQTNGKLERLHRSLKAEVLNGRSFADLDSVAREFQRWRAVYHHRRPHAALGMATPMQRCAASAKSYPSTLPSIGYAEHDTVVEVGWNGFIQFKGHRLHLSSALHRLPIGCLSAAYRAAPRPRARRLRRCVFLSPAIHPL